MLDVHAPHEKIHGISDFLLHLLTITVGLLIALGLEASVEALHHRHQRKEAEATIREELTENHAKLQAMQKNTLLEIENLQRSLLFLQDLRSGKQDDPKGIQLGFNVEPLPDAAWRTASVTGVLTYMNYGEAQGFALAYHEQDLYESAVAKALLDYEMLDTYLENDVDPRTMNPQDIQTAIPDLRRAMSDLHAMFDWGRAALGTEEAALKLK